MNLKQRLSLYEKLTRLDKPIGILLLLWPTLWALWIASRGHPSWMVGWIFILGTVLMRSAGCAINDYADRKFDAQVRRTQDRPLATGELPPREALAVAGVLALLAFGLILPLNRLTILLSLGALFLAVSYPLTKRFLAIPQAYLGIAFGFGIPMAFAAQTGRLPSLAWWLLLANVFWAVAYDTEYAMVDREDDIKIGIRTSALTFGRYDVLAVMLCHLAMLVVLAGIAVWQHFGVFFYLGLAVAALLAYYQFTLILYREREKCFKAFLHNNWIGAAIFSGIALDYLQRVGFAFTEIRL